MLEPVDDSLFASPDDAAPHGVTTMQNPSPISEHLGLSDGAPTRRSHA
ncbi:MAG: hypothetical protein ACTHV2_06705 [Brachybacterium sp.]|nr:hypothetical protein [Brachybacterium sp.]MDN6303527.1 hypothetical protein [Brachybacterium sp.]MDN6328009.1 hypothetical protein [Brachybacterium sp.]